MKTEYEIRFLEIDKVRLIEKLKALGATEVGDWLQIRKTYDLVNPQPNSWIRLRTNGIATTLTVKEIKTDKIDGTKELEIKVDSFEETDAILKKIGLKSRNFQQNRRHQFIYKNVEIDIDQWPLIPVFAELEGNSEEEIKNVCEKLELDYFKGTTMDITDIYKKVYNIDILKIKELTL